MQIKMYTCLDVIMWLTSKCVEMVMQWGLINVLEININNFELFFNFLKANERRFLAQK